MAGMISAGKLANAARAAQQAVPGCLLSACVDLDDALMLCSEPAGSLSHMEEADLAVAASNALSSPLMAEIGEAFARLTGNDGQRAEYFRHMLVLGVDRAHVYIRLPGHESLAAIFLCDVPKDPDQMLQAARRAVAAEFGGLG